MRVLKFPLLASLMLVLAAMQAGHAKEPAKNTENNREKALIGSVSAKGLSAKDYSKAARISSDEATKAAVAAAPGQLLSIGLEEEDGYLIYAVELVGSDSTLREIIVDAGNGNILSNAKKHNRLNSEDGDEHEDRENEEGDDD